MSNAVNKYEELMDKAPTDFQVPLSNIKKKSNQSHNVLTIEIETAMVNKLKLYLTTQDPYRLSFLIEMSSSYKAKSVSKTDMSNLCACSEAA